MDKRAAAQRGGLARIRMHGNPGTADGRRLGGIRSAAIQKKQSTGFVTLRAISFPRESVVLAELLGILAGDGHVSEYQVSVTTNSDTDKEHAEYVQALLKKLFVVPVSCIAKKNKKAFVVYLSSREVVRFLIAKGAVKGHKIRGGVCMPPWIRTRKSYRIAFLRGLFDTDGSVYVDTHRINARMYKNIGMAFTNRSAPLLEDFRQSLSTLGLHPTQKTKYTVFLRREGDIRQYFEVVGSSNPKHLRKIALYFSTKKTGGVA